MDGDLFGDLPDEATPQEVVLDPDAEVPSPFGLYDTEWTNEDWFALLDSLVENEIVTWREITSLVLGHLNPSQVGTSLASSAGFKRNYGKGKTMSVVMAWANEQTGQCADCGTRLELQADHIEGKEHFDEPLDADFIENITLRCRRCNVVRRPSHEFGGLTNLTAESALMWILFVIRPRTFLDFKRLCRIYGMTMADIRMAEAWSMAHWLARSDPPKYGIEDDKNTSYKLLRWPDGAVTRTGADGEVPAGVEVLEENVDGSSTLGFITEAASGQLKFHEQSLAFIPFSTYDLGVRPANSLAVAYTPPDREAKTPQRLTDLAPRGLRLVCYGLRNPTERFVIASTANLVEGAPIANSTAQGRILRTRIPVGELTLQTIDLAEEE